MSFRTQDEAKLIAEFLTWYDPHGDGSADAVLVRAFLEQRQAEAISCYLASPAGT